MAVDLDTQLVSHLAIIAQQGVGDNQRLAEETLLAFQKDVFQGGQGEAGLIYAGLNTADRIPVIKAAAAAAAAAAANTK